MIRTTCQHGRSTYPPKVPPSETRPYCGLINHWFSLVSLIKPLFLWGGTLGGGRLTSHKQLNRFLPLAMVEFYDSPVEALSHGIFFTGWRSPHAHGTLASLHNNSNF